MSTMLKWVAGAAALLGFAGCAGRDAATDATITLAEANYPGQLELLDSQRQKDNYRVILAVKGDPVTRISFVVDPDPAKCVPGSRCEARFRKAHDDGLAIGARLKALEAALGRCGVVTRGLESNEIVANFRTVIELGLPIEDQQPAMDRLTRCLVAFRAALPPDAPPAIRALHFRIVSPDAPGAAARLRFELPAPTVSVELPTYLLGLEAGDDSVDSAKLRVAPDYLRRSGLNERLADIARKALATEAGGGTVPSQAVPYGTKLDFKRRDVIRVYILACAGSETSDRRCRSQIAVAMRYDPSSRQASEIAVLHDIRNPRGAVELPPLPGR